jgi:hypothetical protein
MVFSFSLASVAVCSQARGSFRVLCVVATAVTRASCSHCVVAIAVEVSSTFLLVAAAATVACCSSMKTLKVLLSMVGKMVVVRVVVVGCDEP